VFVPFSCAQPIDGLWPPRTDQPRVAIDVVYDDWHSIIIEHLDESGEVESVVAGVASTPHRFREWEFCERAWYLDGHQGVTGVLRSLFWPTASGLGRRDLRRPYQERRADRAPVHWRFVLSVEGSRRLRDSLESLRGDPIPEHPEWFAGKKSYHLFRLCHHVTLDALREAGLPVSGFWGFTGWMTELQLHRVARFHAAAGLAIGADERP
jgi:hypothetical protein